jgi:predicted ATPase
LFGQGTMLERIEIENLGSIRKTGLSLGPLTALLGANASGKTTVMRGIDLFAALRSRPLQTVTFAGHALNGPNWPTLLHGGDPAKRLIFRAFIQSGSLEPDYEMQIGIDWERVSTRIFEQTEALSPEPEFLAERLPREKIEYDETNVGEYLYGIRGTLVPHLRPRSISIACMILRFGNIPTFMTEARDLIQFMESFGTARYFRPNGAAMLRGSDDGEVWSAGEGFVEALAALQNRRSERFEAIEGRLREIFPHIQRIRFDIGSDGKTRRLLFETTRSTRLTPAKLEADGVLTTLFLLWAGTTTTPHGTLLIDEPEAALHPHLMGKRVEFLRSLASGEFTGYPLRVVVATQSVDFVRWLEPSEVRVVEHSQETGTLVHVLPESETLRALVDKFQANTGELWYSGAIGGIPGAGA